MLVSVENTNAQTYITSPGAMPGGRRVEKQPGQQHNIDRRRCAMNAKPIVVHCTYPEEGQDIAEIIKESFRIFYKKSLVRLQNPPMMVYHRGDEWSLDSRRYLCS